MKVTQKESSEGERQMQITPEWMAIGLTGFSAVVGFVGTVWKVDTGNKKTIGAIETGQAVARVREEQHSKDINEIKASLHLIENGESKCKLKFTADIATLNQKTESLQAELTEEKQYRK